MSSYILMIGVAIGGANLRPGATLTDAQDGQVVADLQATYGTGVALWPATDPIVAGAAVAVAALAKNHTNEELGAIMVAAAAKSVSSGAATSAAAAAASASSAAAAMPTPGTFTVAFGDFAALGAGVKTHDYTVVLPANARLLALPLAEGFTGFDDATHGTMSATLGTSAGGNQIGTALNLAAGQTGFPKAMAAGSLAILGSNLGGDTLTLRFTSSVDLNTLTVGAVVVKVLYAVVP